MIFAKRSSIQNKRQDLPLLKQIAISFALFIAALAIRIEYQSETIVDHPLRSDAAKYFSAAYNLRYFSDYSLQRPKIYSDTIGRHNPIRPQSRTDLPPGYPIFQAILMRDNEPIPAYISRLQLTQAALGACVVIFVFLIARQSLQTKPSVIAAALTACSPHLIAMDSYLLTESLFTFIITGGILFLVLAWKFDKLSLVTAGGLLIALSSQVRSVSALAPVFFAIVFIFGATRKQSALTFGRSLAHAAIILLCALFIMLAHEVFLNRYVTNIGSISKPPEHFVSFTRPITKYTKNLHPPNFYVRDDSHTFSVNLDRDWKRPTKVSFFEIPRKYITWNAWSKFIIMHSWDNAYNMGVYIYPVQRSGFEQNRILELIHNGMHRSHELILFLALAGLALIATQAKRNKLTSDQVLILIPAIFYVYLISLLYFMSWLPRYTIPGRPFLYILASYVVSRPTEIFAPIMRLQASLLHWIKPFFQKS